MFGKRFAAFVVAGLIILTAGIFPASANQTADEIIDYKLNEESAASVQAWIDGTLSENPASSSEWYALALSQYGSYDFSKYGQALLDSLSANETGSATSRLKFALVLIACGTDDDYINKTLDDSAGQQGLMSWIYALHLLNNGVTSDKFSLSGVTETLLSFQLEDGGWAVMGQVSDVDSTAMAVQALAPHYNDDARVKTAVDKAIVLLSSRQNETGDYSSYGVGNPESTAQVLIALSALNINPETDRRFIKNGKTVIDGIELYRLSDGSYCHQLGGESNGTATVQVFCSMVALSRMQSGKSGFYELDIVTELPAPETEAETVILASATETATELTTVTAIHQETLTAITDKASITETQVDVTQKKAEKDGGENGGNTVIYIAVTASVIVICGGVILIRKKKQN